MAGRGDRAHALIAAFTACLLFSQTWIGHIAALSAPAGFGVILAYAAHVLAAGAWRGGLTALIVVSPAFRTCDDRMSASNLLTRFSTVGLVAVVAIIVGGLVNVVARAHMVTLLTSGWGRTLGVRVVLVLAMLALARLNRLVLTPRLSTDGSSKLDAMIRSVALEQVFGIATLGLTAVLGIPDPAG